MQKWEYTVYPVALSEEALNKLGNEGWELVAVTSDSNGVSVEFYFKRPKQ